MSRPLSRRSKSDRPFVSSQHESIQNWSWPPSHYQEGRKLNWNDGQPNIPLPIYFQSKDIPHEQLRTGSHLSTTPPKNADATYPRRYRAAADTNRMHMGPELTETIGCIHQSGNIQKRVNHGDATREVSATTHPKARRPSFRPKRTRPGVGCDVASRAACQQLALDQTNTLTSESPTTAPTQFAGLTHST